MQMTGKKSQDMLLIEECVRHLKQREDIDGNLVRISRVLNRSFDLNFTISIVNNDTNEFFGMSIYPEENQIDKMVHAILYDKARSSELNELWRETKNWYLEIDSLLLYDPSLNANPAEIVAVLLHEIGHVVYSNEIPQRVNKVVRYEIMSASFKMRRLLAWSKAQKLFDIIFIAACSSKNYRHINLDQERIADQFAVKMGYAEALDSLMDKLISAKGNALINRTEEDMDQDVRGAVTWSLSNISELEFRKTRLRTALQAELLKNPSKFVRQIVYSIKNVFFGDTDNDNNDAYKAILTEQYLIKEYQKIVSESMIPIFDKAGKVKKITQNDLDILMVEASGIKTGDDKIYILDLIYDKMNIIDAALAIIQDGEKEKVPVPKETLQGFRRQLEDLRQQVLKAPITPDTYGVFIKYPAGYEG